MDLADARGIAVADAVDYLISKGQAQTQELRERLAYFDSLERELKRYWDENLIEDAWQGWDSLMDLLENQRMYEESLRRHIQSWKPSSRHTAKCSRAQCAASRWSGSPTTLLDKPLKLS
jgi:hypothetical protein